jgi:hypothetical protein
LLQLRQYEHGLRGAVAAQVGGWLKRTAHGGPAWLTEEAAAQVFIQLPAGYTRRFG